MGGPFIENSRGGPGWAVCSREAAHAGWLADQLDDQHASAHQLGVGGLLIVSGPL